MIIGISGSQGQGKSTCINGVRAAHPEFDIVTPNIQTSRSVLYDMGISLSMLINDISLRLVFQDRIFDSQYSAVKALTGNHTYMVERTFADIFAYTCIAVGPHDRHSDWLDEYYEKCKAANAELFDINVFLTGRKYTPVDDGVRPTSDKYGTAVGVLIEHYVEHMAPHRYTVSVESVNDRVEQITTIIKDNTHAE